MFAKLKKWFHTLCDTSPEEKAPVRNQSRRNEDLSAEAQLSIFMDLYLYDRFPTSNLFSSIRRITSKEEQLNGIDVEFIGTDNKVYNVDEKAQLYYLNQNLPTFAFELVSYQKGFDTIGWLCNPNLKTDFYMLIWPFATTNTCKEIRWEQFTKVECLLIQKQKILKLLADNGLTINRLKADAASIRASGKVGKIPIQGLSGIYYFASNPLHYKEAPINIIISKQKLTEIAQRKYVVTPEQITST